ncbi:MAG: ATP-dependent DNA helicase, partial [Actinomycetota bacterium]|nr:ATP-dependent DNA helicase [Actinomycetota bacterium]
MRPQAAVAGSAAWRRVGSWAPPWAASSTTELAVLTANGDQPGGGFADRVLTLLDAALAAVPGSVDRPGQRTMAVAVDRALRSGEHLLVQAGTGTGKSLAYLVPALASGGRVVVATATKALQAQLVDKDLPRLVAALTPALGATPTFALAKGRSNYVCLQQLHDGPGARAAEPEALFEGPSSDLGRQVVALREWALGTDSGDRDEVPFPVGERAWRQVSVSARECLGTRCPDRVDCFSEKAREAARDADIVVANHALLALDTFTGASVLPERAAVILDEAHEFVASATDALTHELSAGALRRAAAAAGGYLDDAMKARLDDAADAAEGLLGSMVPGWIPQLPAGAADLLALIESSCAAAASGVGGDSSGDEIELAKRERAKVGLNEVAEAARELREPRTASAVYATASGATLALRVSPLSVGRSLASRLFGETTVVATSATLTLGGSFDHLAAQLGLVGLEPEDDDPPPPRWRGIDVGSPFSYSTQAQLWVADDLPDPGRFPVAWAAAVDAAVVELVAAAGGRTLALFSSTAAAVRCAEAVRTALDLPVLLQGEDSPGALQHRFASDARACLFGTRSFWQGVDTPGSACQLVIIDRLPFPHVDDPLLRARLAAAGPAGFMTVTLPPAAVLLAQGAGRLI